MANLVIADEIFGTIQAARNEYRPAPSAIKMSAETLRLITNGLITTDTIDYATAKLYGIPLIVDDSLPLNAVQYEHPLAE